MGDDAVHESKELNSLRTGEHLKTLDFKPTFNFDQHQFAAIKPILLVVTATLDSFPTTANW